MNDAPLPCVNVRQLSQRNLLAVRRAHQQVPDLCGAAAELRLHADYEVEEFFALNHLRRGLAAHGRLDDSFHVCYVDSVARDFFAIHIDQKAGLAEFAYNREFREARNLRERVLDLEGLVLKHVEILSVDLYRERALQAGERFIHCIFGRLRVIEDDAGKAVSFLLMSSISFAFVRMSPFQTLSP